MVGTSNKWVPEMAMDPWCCDLAILFFDGRLKITSEEEMVCHTRFPPFLQA